MGPAEGAHSGHIETTLSSKQEDPREQETQVKLAATIQDGTVESLFGPLA